MEPMASPTWSDLLQTIKEKKYRVSADYLLCRTDRPNIAFSTAQAARAFLDQMQSVIDRANQTLAEFSEEERPE